MVWFSAPVMLTTLLLNSLDLLLVIFYSKIKFLNSFIDSKIGERATLEGWEGITQAKEKAIDPKKKILETVLPKFEVDAEGYAVFQGRIFLFWQCINGF